MIGRVSGGYQRLGKKMILPLLVGILLKVASFVPLILGKLSLLALVSIVASKLALIISAIIGSKKLYGAGMPYSYSHHGGDWDGAASSLSYATDMAHQAIGHGHLGGHLNHRRVNPSATGYGFNSIANTIAAHVGRSLQLDRSVCCTVKILVVISTTMPWLISFTTMSSLLLDDHVVTHVHSKFEAT